MNAFNGISAVLADCYPNASQAEIAALAFFEASAPDLSVAEFLASRGVNVETATLLAGPIAGHRVIFKPRGVFDFSETGDPALVHVVFGADGETPIDLVAWEPNRPSRYATLLGSAGLLGADHVDKPTTYFDGKPLQVFRTPLNWLRHDCRGVVVLHRQSAGRALAKAPGPIAAEDLRHGEALARAFGTTVPIERILIPMEGAA